jgi:serine/threonine protein kinase
VKSALCARGENSLEREVELLSGVSHPHVCGLVDHFSVSGCLHVVLEFCGGGDFFDYLESRPGRFLEDAEAGPCIAQLLGAISFLHERAVIHGDVKPENMLLETSEACTRVKLADFGLGRMCASGNWCHGLCGSEHYMALEVLEGRFNALCDVWSSGCVLYECLRGEQHAL